jgi:lambda repressor-like predicted transcriptional regulator
MSADEVLNYIAQLHNNGESLAKKNVKKLHPDLMKNALHYYPSWDHAIQKTGVNITH